MSIGRRGWWRIGIAAALCVAGTGTAAVASGEAPAGVRPAVSADEQRAPNSEDGLQVVSVSVDRTKVRGLTVVRALLANLGPNPVTDRFTATVRLPKGVTVEGRIFPDDCRLDDRGRELTCRFRKGLGLRRTATVLVPLRVADDVRPGQRLAGTVSLQDPDHPTRSAPTRAYTIDVQ
ncbi:MULTISPECIES: hypothetical protein [Kitasatospora]|uniref:DUF11 domain-containing protein n=1 Tax=Kitasatospora setae (strain ATCC 33774 / DSM 43861 / JCM 3304 / KCC A-0304 / NBRC 14216 / KM-6054) TaxID=452652 RepID=E4N2C4_KITSK|nr:MULTISPECIES: hypothetical protein [Kitasatospora]BAJ32308.1 hypothetical protein KSE_65490 [Kitasatospora setae KM-6054]